MTDEEYVYREDIRDKKSTARGVYGRKGKTGKSKKCTMPSDYLTKKEKEKMNGPVISVDLNKFYTWEEFKEFSDRMKVEWLNHMINKYKISINRIDTDIFGNGHRKANGSITSTNLWMHLKKARILDQIHTTPGYKPNKEDIWRLHNDMLASKNHTFEKWEEKPQPKTGWQKDEPQPDPDPTPIKEGTIEVENDISVDTSEDFAPHKIFMVMHEVKISLNLDSSDLNIECGTLEFEME